MARYQNTLLLEKMLKYLGIKGQALYLRLLSSVEENNVYSLHRDNDNEMLPNVNMRILGGECTLHTVLATFQGI